MAIAGGGRLCRTRHEPRVDRRIKRDRHPVANPAGSPAIATPSPDAGEKMGARLDGQPQALLGRAALQPLDFFMLVSVCTNSGKLRKPRNFL